MPTADFAAIITSLQPLTFASIAEAPVKPGVWFGPCLLGPGVGSDWVLGNWDGEAWYDNEGDTRLNPAYWALLPVTQGGLKTLASRHADDLEAHIAADRFDEAAKLIDKLADEVRALRDNSPLLRHLEPR